MTFKDGKPTDFYNSYVKDIQSKITQNAAAEFQCIQREHVRLKGAKPRTLISDELSIIITDLQEELEQSDLFDDVPSRRGVLARAIPETLLNKVGLDSLLNRLPEQYQRALFSSWVASHYVCAVIVDFIPSLNHVYNTAGLQVWRGSLERGLFSFRARPGCLNTFFFYFLVFPFFVGTKCYTGP